MFNCVYFNKYKNMILIEELQKQITPENFTLFISLVCIIVGFIYGYAFAKDIEQINNNLEG